MALSDCDYCWDTPCTCGHKYDYMDVETIKVVRDHLTKLINSAKPCVECDRLTIRDVNGISLCNNACINNYENNHNEQGR